MFVPAVSTSLIELDPYSLIFFSCNGDGFSRDIQSGSQSLSSQSFVSWLGEAAILSSPESKTLKALPLKSYENYWKEKLDRCSCPFHMFTKLKSS